MSTQASGVRARAFSFASLIGLGAGLARAADDDIDGKKGKKVEDEDPEKKDPEGRRAEDQDPDKKNPDGKKGEGDDPEKKDGKKSKRAEDEECEDEDEDKDTSDMRQARRAERARWARVMGSAPAAQSAGHLATACHLLANTSLRSTSIVEAVAAIPAQAPVAQQPGRASLDRRMETVERIAPGSDGGAAPAKDSPAAFAALAAQAVSKVRG